MQRITFLILFPLAALSLMVAGCETNGIATRIQEKSAAYAELKPEVQKNIREGTIEPGYTADMVYMALGKPSKQQVKTTSQGKVGIWIYSNFYPEGFETSAAAANKVGPATRNESGVVATASAPGTGGALAKYGSSPIKTAPTAGAIADDDGDDTRVTATSSFVNVGSSDYGHAKYETPESSYTATDRRGFKPYQANSSTFSDRSAAMEALDVPEMDSASLYVVFFEGRVVQMKLGRN